VNIERRIERAEELVDVKDELPCVFIRRLAYDEATIPHFPEPVEDWVTFRESYSEAKRTGMPFLAIAPDPYAEYEARHELEPGTLSKHELCGKVPFEQLLAAATTQRKRGQG